MNYFVNLTDDTFSVYGFEVTQSHAELLKALKDNNLYPITKEAYDYCMQNNGNFHSVVNDNFLKRLEDYKTIKNSYIEATEQIINLGKKGSKKVVEIINILDVSDFSTEHIYEINGVIKNRQRKNIYLCQDAITFGIVDYIDGERIRFDYKIEDQLNYEEKIKMIKEGILNDETGVPVKGVDQPEYRFVPVKVFTSIYKKLVYSKYYNLFYVRVLNKYLETITDPIVIEKMTYEVQLPQEFKEELDELLKPYKEYRDGDEL